MGLVFFALLGPVQRLGFPSVMALHVAILVIADSF